jgi:hypothetical protein
MRGKLRLRTVQYTGEIFTGEMGFQPELMALLRQVDLLLEMDLPAGAGLPWVAVGVPHHAPAGVSRIAEDWERLPGKFGRVSDENAGLSALLITQALHEAGLPCRLIIAAHASDHDPNKNSASPYFERLFAAPLPGLLLEIHGSNGSRESELEISGGSNPLSAALPFGQAVAARGAWWTAAQLSPGVKAARAFKGSQTRETVLKLPALKTTSLVRAGELGIPAFHLELKPVFRDFDLSSRMAWLLAQDVAAAVKNDPGWPGGRSADPDNR